MQGLQNVLARGRLGAEVAAQPRRADFHGAQPLLQGFLEGAADAHGLAHALHGGGQLIPGAGKFFKGKTRNFDHTVVNGRFKAGHCLAGDVIAQLVQRVAHGQLGCDFGNGKARGLGGQGRGARHARVHLNDHDFAVFRINSELYIAAAGFHADFAHDGNGGIANLLVFHIRQGLNRGHGNGVAGMHAHRVEVFDGADDHAIVFGVAHDLHLDFFPAQHALLDHHLGRGAGGKAARGHLFQIRQIVGHAPARAAQGERGAHNERKRQHIAQPAHLVHIAGDTAGRHFQAYVFHGFAEQLTAFGLFNNLSPRADELHPAFRQNAALGKSKSGVQCRLAAQRGQQGVRTFLADDGRQGVLFDGLHIGGVGQLWISHDGGRIGVDQHHLIAFFLEGLDGLGTGVIKLATLTDDDGTRAENKNFV